MITKVINVNLHQPIYERLTAKQGDIASRYLLFHLLDGDKPFDLSNRTVRVYAIKPDKTEIFNDLTINDASKGYCTLELTSQCLAAAGVVKMELYISQSGKVLTSIPFELEVIACINTANGVVSTNEFSALEIALSSLQDYDNLRSEIVQARKGYTTVGKRLDNFDSQLDNMKSDYISYNKSKSFTDNLKNTYLKMLNESYTLEGDININSNNINILGNTSKIVGNYNFIVNNRDVYIENVIFDGLDCINFTGSKNVILRNCKIINNTKFGVICSDCDNVYITNCTFIDNGLNVAFENSSGLGFSILANKVKTLKVNNCYFEGTRGQAAIRVKEVDYSEIRFNNFNDNFFRAIEYSALDGGYDYYYKGDASYNYIIDCGKRNNNTRWDEGTNGIFGNACLYGVDLIGNTIINSRENGIEGRFRYVRDNYIDGTGVGSRPTTATNGISASCKYIINNVLKNCNGHAITTGGNGKYVNHCSIVGNYFENCEGGILLHFTESPSFGNLTVANNLNKDGYCIKVINNYTPNSYKDTVGKVTFYNNKGDGLPPDNKVTIEHNNFKLLDHYEKLIKNNNFLNRTSNTVNGFYFNGSPTVTTTNFSDYINLNVTGTPYNASTNSDIEVSNIENVILNFRINYKADHIKIIIYETQFDGSSKQIYSIEDTNDTHGYKLLNYCVRPFSQLTTGKLKLQLITSSNSIDYKEISLNCYNM